MEEYTNYLVHHGVKGMKWGVRRYQNADGSLTSNGQKRYNKKIKDLKRYTESSANFWREQRRLDPYVSEAKRTKTKMIVPKDQLNRYEKAYKQWEKEHKIMTKKYKEVLEDRKVMDDGYEYVIGKINDPSLGGQIQYYGLIGKAKS